MIYYKQQKQLTGFDLNFWFDYMKTYLYHVIWLYLFLTMIIVTIIILFIKEIKQLFNNPTNICKNLMHYISKDIFRFLFWMFMIKVKDNIFYNRKIIHSIA